MKLNNKDVTKKYLTEPFNNLINKKGFATNKNTMYIIRGTTGLGKTYATFNDFIPALFGKHNLDLVIYSYPKTEVFDKMDANLCITESILQSGKHVQLCTSVKEAMTYLKKGYKVLLCLTHAAITNKNGKKFMRDLEGMGLITGYFVDESHSWMISHIDNYRNVMGSNTPKYEGGLFKMLSKLAERTPYIFGLTATPNAEQINKVPVIGSMQFKMMNDYPKLEETIGRSGWMGSVTTYDLEGLDKSEIFNLFGDAVELHLKESDLYGKGTMMIKVGRANCGLELTMENVQNYLKYLVRCGYIEYLGKKSDMVAVLTSDFKGFINFIPCVVGNNNGIKIEYTTRTEDEVKDALANTEHNCQILLVVEKGDMGMNIHNLKTFFSFRRTDKDMGTLYDKEPITENAIQTIGRMMRIYTGVSNEEFTDKWGYDLTEYVKSLTDDEVEDLLELNSYKIYVPNNEMWNASISAIRKDLSPSKEMANASIKEIRNNI